MSAPLVVNTTDGTCWTRRAMTRSGEALYAPEGVCSCPEFVMATLSELAEHGIVGSADVLPVPAGAGPETYPPALPWAALMDHEDLTEFLDELAASAITHASSEVALAEVEATCGRWRLIAEAQHGHNTAPGPDAMTRTFAPTQVLRNDACSACGSLPEEWCPDCAACRKGCHGGNEGNPCTHPNAPWVKSEDVTPQVEKLRALLAGQRAALEDPHDSPLHHSYRLGRDLPPVGGA